MRTVVGDILEIECGIICHQVNCQRVANAGLAQQIRHKWPDWYEAFRAWRPHLGQVRWYMASDDLWIASLYAQDEYGRDRRHTNYATLGACLMAVATKRLLFVPDGLDIYIPFKMGCELGGGDWTIVSQIIEDALPDAIIVRLKEERG